MRSSWSLSLCIFECKSGNFTYGIRSHHKLGSFCNRFKHFCQIQILVGSNMHSFCSYLSCNSNQRCSISGCIRNTGYQVCSSRPQCGKTYTSSPCQPSIYISHKSSSLLMPCCNKLNIRMSDCFHQFKSLFSRNSKNVFYSFIFQTFYQKLCRCFFFYLFLQHYFCCHQYCLCISINHKRFLFFFFHFYKIMGKKRIIFRRCIHSNFSAYHIYKRYLFFKQLCFSLFYFFIP